MFLQDRELLRQLLALQVIVDLVLLQITSRLPRVCGSVRELFVIEA